MENLKNACSSLYRLCETLFSNTPINYFSYGMMDDKRNLNFLTSDYRVAEYYLHREHYNSQFLYKSFEEIEVGNLYLSSLPGTSGQLELRDHISTEFGIGNLFGIYQRQGNQKCFFTFGCDSKNIKAINYFLNNTDFLSEYSGVMQNAARNLIDVNQLPLIQVNHKVRENNGEKIRIKLPKSGQLQILSSLLINSKFKNKTSELSNRELECLEYIIAGRGSSKEIARMLGISFRTVEHHISNLKYKLDCKKKSDLQTVFANTTNNQFFMDDKR